MMPSEYVSYKSEKCPHGQGFCAIFKKAAGDVRQGRSEETHDPFSLHSRIHIARLQGFDVSLEERALEELKRKNHAHAGSHLRISHA